MTFNPVGCLYVTIAIRSLWSCGSGVIHVQLNHPLISQGMEGLVEKGLVRAIGLSNFTITKAENLLKTAKTVPAANQVECHPFFQQQKLKEYCDSKGKGVVSMVMGLVVFSVCVCVCVNVCVSV